MASLPPSLVQLTAALSGLPGIGPRSAERLALHLIQLAPADVAALCRAITEACQSTVDCEVCGCLTEQQPCSIWLDDSRSKALICVVEQAVDILGIERSGAFKGKYHVLGGRISPLNGIGPEDLKIEGLEKRLKEGTTEEIVLALGSDVEGDVTCHYPELGLRNKG